jgi:hypothetical protein
MLKRLMMAAAIVVIAVSGATTAGADGKDETSEQTIIKSRTFTIAKGQCSQLPGNVEIQGLGLERTTTRIGGRDDFAEDEERVSLSGSLLSRITGTATDNLGGRYTFSYQLSFTKPAPIPGSGIVVDRFKLTGTGLANGLSTFFRVRVTFDSGFTPIAFEVLEQSGNPFGGCDPL